ncbi:F0F1 ATP synthase subunit B [Skermania piniformis]|uniref:ATP synthase subunit b n=1 Tax=Skermania pinensis TaxID=39122 RepID=A0ABX8SC57_9ACTN|nr:F0F1 ATP synthase subunit B [Skermania piniformis]QXQ14757.1 F0F1 ATP synthase subunit B [Skermania piniformis]
MNEQVLAEGDNFLLPNGTFFVELAIFLVVFWVIWKFVVPSIREVLEARERMVSQTAADNQAATRAFADAEVSYREELATARSAAGKIRDDARSVGQRQLEVKREQARKEAESAQQLVAAELERESVQVAAELQQHVGPLSDTLANRVLGVDDSGIPAGATRYADRVGRGTG